MKFAPGAPDPPRPERVTKDSVTLSWKPPSKCLLKCFPKPVTLRVIFDVKPISLGSDGGSRIRGYIMQKKAKGDKDWSDVNDFPHPTTNMTVPNLKEGEEYTFRVIGVNDIGRGQPSRPSNGVVVEEQPNKPRLDLGGVRDITVRAGEDFSISIPFVAFPKPTATWSNNDVILDDTDSRVFQQTGDDYASIVVKNSKRSDTGQYKLQVKNPYGFDTVSLNVRVMDRPGPPQNLRGDEFAGEALTLCWLPPKGKRINYSS